MGRRQYPAHGAGTVRRVVGGCLLPSLERPRLRTPFGARGDITGLLSVDSFEKFCQGFQEWAKQSFERVQAQNRKSGEELFRQIEEYVRLNLYSYLSIADVALKFHVSPSYISRVMKNYAQNTFVQYYTGLKIKEACRLMACKPEMRIKEVSDALSFSDQHYFSKVFKEYTGYSPTDYKERCPPNSSDSSS